MNIKSIVEQVVETLGMEFDIEGMDTLLQDGGKLNTLVAMVESALPDVAQPTDMMVTNHPPDPHHDDHTDVVTVCVPEQSLQPVTFETMKFGGLWLKTHRRPGESLEEAYARGLDFLVKAVRVQFVQVRDLWWECKAKAQD